MRPTLTVEEAREKVLSAVAPLPPTNVPVFEALGRALAEPVIAREAMPPFDNSAVDGFAVQAGDVEGASPEKPVSLRVVGHRVAGRGDVPPVGKGEAVRLMTGAPVPSGADAVVMIEATSAWDPAGDTARTDTLHADTVLILRGVARGDNIRPRGEGVMPGAVLLEAGHCIGAAEIGLLIAVGEREVSAHPLPRVGVLSTGDEVVSPDATPGPGEIRDSNRPTLLAAVTTQGFVAVDLGLVGDDPDRLRNALVDGGSRVDFLLTSGGVSVGDRDLTRRVLEETGTAEAYRVLVKPGMPQVFGNVQGTPVFGLPGNPVSSLVVFEEFVLPALCRMAGRREVHPPRFVARLTETVERRPGRVEFLRVRLDVEEGRWTASPAGAQGSGILSSMTRANGYAILPADSERVEAGTEVVCRFRPRA